jgi:hypothetical protein
MSTTVDALMPLSFLEAVRRVDSPDDLEAEFVPELRNKRLGLSETVYAQIRRYSDAVKRQHRPEQEEAVGIAKLIGRRPDAETVFREAGKYLAREAYLTIPASKRQMLSSFPSLVARPLALRQIRWVAERYLNAKVRRVGSFLVLKVERSVTADSAPPGVGCVYYEFTLRELLQLMSVSGNVEHVRCASRGEGECEWRANWRTADAPAAAE